MDLIGKYEGFYEYGGGYILPQFGSRVDILVTIKGKNDNFSGTVNEILSEHSVPLMSTLSGFKDNDFVSFVKRYDQLPSIKQDGSNEVVLGEGELEIEHTGYVDTKNKSIYGKWFIHHIGFDEEGEYESTSEGIWFLKKVG